MYETMLIVSVVVFVCASLIYLRHPSASLYNPATFYLLFHGMVFVVRPIFGWVYQYRQLYTAMKFTPTLWDKTQVLIATNLALIVFMTVSMLLTRQFRIAPASQYKERSREELLHIFIPIAILISIPAVYALYYLWGIKNTGATLNVIDARTGGGRLDGLNGYLIAPGSMLASVVAIFAYLGRFRLWSLLPFLGFAVLRLGMGSRGDVVASLSMIALMYLFDQRKKWPNKWVILAIVVFVPIFNSIQADRGARIRQALGQDTVVDVRDYSGQPLETIDLANMEFFEYIVYVVPQRSGTYDYFRNNLSLFTEPIPRSLWPNKPLSGTTQSFELYKYGDTVGGTWSVPGTGWLSWGYPGVAIWSAFFALLYGLPYSRFMRGPQSHLAVVSIMILVSTAIVGYRDGVLVTIAKLFFFYYTPVVLLLVASRYVGIYGSLIRNESEAPGLVTAGLGTPLAPKDRRAAAASGNTLAAVEQGGDLSASVAHSAGEAQGARAARPTPESPRDRRRARMAEA